MKKVWVWEVVGVSVKGEVGAIGAIADTNGTIR